MTLRRDALLGLILVGSGCATSTGGELVTLTGQVRVLEEPSWAVGGWIVALDRATLAVGPVYLWTERPNLDLGEWAGLLGTTPARAEDPFAAGRLVGELPRQVVVDLTADEAVSLGEGTAIVGPVGSAEVWLEPRAGGPTLSVAGTASRAIDGGVQILPFRADITWDASWVETEAGRNEVLIRRVRGLPLEGSIDGPVHLELGLDPTAWLDAADLDALPDVPPDTNGVRVLTPDSRTGRGLDQGVRSLASDGPWRPRLEPR